MKIQIDHKSCCDGLQLQYQFDYLVQNCKVQISQFNMMYKKDSYEVSRYNPVISLGLKILGL